MPPQISWILKLITSLLYIYIYIQRRYCVRKSLIHFLGEGGAVIEPPQCPYFSLILPLSNTIGIMIRGVQLTPRPDRSARPEGNQTETYRIWVMDQSTMGSHSQNFRILGRVVGFSFVIFSHLCYKYLLHQRLE